MKIKRYLVPLVVLIATVAMASHHTYEYKDLGFSAVFPLRNHVERETGDDNSVAITYSDEEPWHMDMIVVYNNIDYTKISGHKAAADAMDRIVAKPNFTPTTTVRWDKDAAGNEFATDEFIMHTPASKGVDATDTHVTLRFYSVVGTSRLYQISVLRNIDNKQDDYEFINSFKLLP